MEYVVLNNGVRMPKLGYGVYQVSKEECTRCVLDAIKAGYRLIDTAQSYFNEAEVGEAIAKCGIPRENLFITTKVWLFHTLPAISKIPGRQTGVFPKGKMQSARFDKIVLHRQSPCPRHTPCPRGNHLVLFLTLSFEKESEY